MNTFLHILLYLNLPVIGVLLTLAVQHALAHYRPHAPEPDKVHPADARLPATVRRELLETASANFQAILDKSASELQHDLKETAIEINGRLGKLGGETLDKEMERYQTEFDALRKQTLLSVGGAMADMATQEAALKAQLETDVALERERLVQLIDTKLGDAVASFLLEALQHNVDLGAQAPYLTKLLEEHKAEFKAGVADEAKPA